MLNSAKIVSNPLRVSVCRCVGWGGVSAPRTTRIPSQEGEWYVLRESPFSEGSEKIGYTGSGESITLDMSLPSRHLHLESKSHSENEKPYSRLVSTAGECLFLVSLMGKENSVWQPLIGGKENGDSGVERGFD